MGDVNVCTSYMIHCYAAEISGMVLLRYMLLHCCWVGVGGWGMLTYLVVSYMIHCDAAEISGMVLLRYMFATLLLGWGGRGGGGC